MKFVIDKDIPFIKGVFEPWAEVVYLEGSAIARVDLLDADALIIRTRTRCDAALLAGTGVKIIATATIGFDHIDLDYCASKGIYVRNAAGCNAGGVMNYVFSALYGAAARKSIPLTGATFGIIGVGNVGKRIERMARQLGFKVLLCDPPRAENENPALFTPLEETLAASDIISLHVPLNPGTRGMANAEFFARMRPGAFFINSARGEVVVDEDLIAASGRLGPIIIDTWNNEPDVNTRLVECAEIATPHIAGYSYQGKQLGTREVVRATARYFNIEPLYEFFPAADVKGLEAVKLDFNGKNQGQIAAMFQYNYPVFTDDFIFRTNPADFERLRDNYKYRREFFAD
ncbi:MAG: 4-phosphoerythronate dehydrogenase [Bacteroidales bacterium]|nr:4-phosphoerythronate dehydrogenase [Bacteroidales bacterium]